MRVVSFAAIPLIVASCLGLQVPRGIALSARPCTQPDGVSALANGPDNTLLAGTIEGRLYRSRDGGHCFAAIAAPLLKAAIGIVLVPPGHPSWIIAGTSVSMTGFSGGYEGPGLYRSEDGGRTWKIGTAGLTVRSLIPGEIAVSRDGTLLLGYGCPRPSYFPCAGGLARSTDGGRTWGSVGPHDAVGQSVVTVGTRGFLAVVLSSAGSQTVAHADRSSDDGRTWHSIGTLPGNAFDVTTLIAPAWQPSLILAGYGAAMLQARIARSLTGGRRWAFVAGTLSPRAGPPGLVAAFAAVGSKHRLLLSVYGAVCRSDDGGAMWSLSSRGLPAHRRLSIEVLFTAPDGETVYAGNANVASDAAGHYHTLKDAPGAGLYRSTDGGVTWAPNA